MFYRRKVILAILGEFGGQISKTSLQKLIFLFTMMQETKSYDFFPYSYGCYSITANHDLTILEKENKVKEIQQKSFHFWVKIDNEDYGSSLTKADYAHLKNLYRSYNSTEQNDLIRHTYQRYPYYAINSKIAGDLLDKKEFARVNNQKRPSNEKTLFTIGYEGRSLEQFLNHLVINDIKLLIDVRKNALSRKFGFSKSQIANACKCINVTYLHMPELGIDSERRKHLCDEQDYSTLLNNYEHVMLPAMQEPLLDIIKMLKRHNRIALMCFEKMASMCHRGRIINVLSNRSDFTVPIRNL